MDWYAQLRLANPWLPPADMVLEAELTYGPTNPYPVLAAQMVVKPPPAPAPAWPEALPAVPRPARNALPDALVHLAQAMEATGNGRACRAYLVDAGAQVRAMGRTSEVWGAAYRAADRDVLAELRAAASAVVQAADWKGRGNPERAAGWLRAADGILHGLWLDAR